MNDRLWKPIRKARGEVSYPPLRGIVQLTNSDMLRFRNWSFTNKLSGFCLNAVNGYASVHTKQVLICKNREKIVHKFLLLTRSGNVVFRHFTIERAAGHVHFSGNFAFG
jgi:hypothetical protein